MLLPSKFKNKVYMLKKYYINEPKIIFASFTRTFASSIIVSLLILGLFSFDKYSASNFIKTIIVFSSYYPNYTCKNIDSASMVKLLEGEKVSVVNSKDIENFTIKFKTKNCRNE